MKTLCVLLHGYPNNTEVWKDQLPFLREKYDLLNLALPGSETGIVSRDDLRLNNLISEIVHKIEASSHDKVILIGHDIGSFLLAEVASLLGEKVKAQIFLSGMDFRLFRNHLQTSLQLIKSWYVLLLQIPFLPEKLVPQFKKLLSRQVYKDSPDLSKEAPHGFSPVAIYRELKAGLTNKKESKSAIPTLFLFGEDDRYILPPARSEINRYYQKASMDILPGGHWFMRENPEIVNKKISAFLGDLA